MNDAERYTQRSILRSEWVYGPGCQSPGGEALTTLLVSQLPATCDRLLIMGCGLGCEVSVLAAKYPEARIDAVDAAPAMIEECKRRSTDSNVTFSLGDLRDGGLFGRGTFDIIWCRDVVLYVSDAEKDEALHNLWRWLGHGGTMRLTDFGSRGQVKDGSPLSKYMIDKGYHLMPLVEYESRLQQVGFQMKATDVTKMFAAANLLELSALQDDREAFVEKFSASEHDHLVERWAKKHALATAADGMAYYDFLCSVPPLRVYCAATCDIFHAGHVTLFRNVKQQFPRCHFVVGVAGDEAVETYKVRPLNGLAERAHTVEGCRYVDEVIRGAPARTNLSFVEANRFDIVVSRDDYSPAQVEDFYPGIPETMHVKLSYKIELASSIGKPSSEYMGQENVWGGNF